MSRKTRKLIWSAPLVAAIAVVGALALFMALQPNQAAAQTEEEVPGTPTNLTATALDPTSIELSWDPPTDGGTPDGYRIDYSEDGMVWYSLEPSYDSTVYTDDSGLMAKQMRYYRVFAYNSSGHGRVLGPASEETEQSTVPDAIDDLDLEATVEMITLTWTAPDEPEGAPVKTYRIQESKNGRSYSNLEMEPKKVSDVCDGDTCTYEHKDLLESTKRWYRVYAANSVGESSASNAPSEETSAGRIPTMPENLRAGVNPAGSIWLYWDPPVDVGDGTMADDPPGAPILGYYIQGGPVAYDAESVPVEANTFVKPTTLIDESTTVLETVDGTAPKKDVLYYVEASTDSALTSRVLNRLDDFAPGKPGTFDPDTGVDDVDEDDIDDNEAEDDIITHWGFRVMAVNRVVQRNAEDGTIATTEGAWTEFIRVNPDADDEPNDGEGDTEDGDVLSRPTLKAKRDTNVNGGRTSIKLEWKTAFAPADQDVVYRLEFSEDRTDWEPIDLSPTAEGDEGENVTTWDHSARTAGTTYYYRVFATHLNITMGDPLGRIFTEASLTVAETTAQADKPDPPMLESVEALSETEIQIMWMRPGDDGSEMVGYGKVVGYMIEESDDGENWMTYKENTGLEKVCGPDGKSATCKITRKDLVQGQTKYFRVSTINNATRTLKLSDPSDADNATTLRSLASDDPGGLVVKPAGRNVIELLWNARADDITAAPITGYKIDSSPLNDDGDCTEIWSVLEADTMSTDTSYTDMGLMAGTGQCYRIFGINVVATSSGFVGYGDDYVTTNDNDAIATTDEAAPNAAPMAGAAIADQTVTAGETAMVQSTITDADTDDTLTWSAMSNMPTYATAEVDDMGMVTITGVAEGMATITVTATDMADATATQDIMVTVEAAGTALTAPSGVLVSTSTFGNTKSISVTWDTTSIQNAEQIKVALFNSDVTALAQPLITINPANDRGADTFSDVPSGTYYVTVASFRTGERHKLSLPLQEVTVE